MSDTTKPVQIALVAPGQALRAGLRALLGVGPGLEVVAEAAALADLAHLRPSADLLVLTSEAAARGDLERALRALGGSPALLLVGDDPAVAQSVVGLPVRAWGLVSLEAPAEELAAAARAVQQGLLVGAPALLQPLLHRPMGDVGVGLEPLAEPLTGREVEVLQFVAQGLANKQIALALAISEHTVKFHISSLYGKLGATNRTEAVRIASRRGLITL